MSRIETKSISVQYACTYWKNCWLGAGVIVLPGVTIGDNTVIGAGSVVTKDVSSGVVALGNPCKVIRKVNEHDYEYYYKNRRINE